MMYVNPGAPVEHRDAIDTTYKRTAPKATTLGGLPQYDADESGTTLGVDEDGELAWVSGGGSGGGVLIVHAEDNEAGTAAVLDKTWQEIHDAAVSSGVVVVSENPIGFFTDYVSSVNHVESGYNVNVFHASTNSISTTIYSTDSATGYPEFIYE